MRKGAVQGGAGREEIGVLPVCALRAPFLTTNGTKQKKNVEAIDTIIMRPSLYCTTINNSSNCFASAFVPQNVQATCTSGVQTYLDIVVHYKYSTVPRDITYCTVTQ